MIKGTAAIKIFTGVALLYLIWLLVQALDMRLISSILAQVMGVGVIALLIVFQQEIRKFFMLISNKYLSRIDLSIRKMIPFISYEEEVVDVWSVVKAVTNLSKEKTGALIAISRVSELLSIIETGVKINADTSSQLICNLFFKNSPLHDGAIVINRKKIIAAGCILPLIDHKLSIDHFGLRHRAAFALSEQTDAVIIVVSEETGEITLFLDSGYQKDITIMQLRKQLESIFLNKKEDDKKVPEGSMV